MASVRLLVHGCCLIVLLVGCDKKDSDGKDSKKEKSDDGVSVSDYCDKLITLDEEVAEANNKGKESSPDEPSGSDQRRFCRMMFSRAKSEEPKAYACMADCMMAAKSREGEQSCIADKKCLAKAKNKKLFSNRTGD